MTARSRTDPETSDGSPGPRFTNHAGLTFSRVPPGTGIVGCLDGLGDPDELPVHRVTFTDAFHLAIHPVTRRQFDRFVRASGHRTVAERDGSSLWWDGADWAYTDGISWRNPETGGGEHHPVTCVTHDDARAFCQWLSEADPDGWRYNLPSEAHWEYACRAGTLTAYHVGDSLSLSQAHFGRLRHGTRRVGSYRPNAWGLYDMHGNVWEWCASPYDTYPVHDVIDPEPTHAGLVEVVRGGSHHSAAAECRSSSRNRFRPGSMRSTDMGFRVMARPGDRGGRG